MPDYEEIIQKSKENVNALTDKLRELDQLHQNIISLKNAAEGIPDIFNEKFQEIVKVTEGYTNTLGAATKNYLDGNNTLFTTKLSELSSKIKEFEKEITRLVNTDFTELFKDLQKVFIVQTRADLATELKRFEEKSKELQLKVDELKREIGRLESIDLEKNFAKLQTTLSEIFGAINNINLTLTTVTQTLNSILLSLGTIQSSIEMFKTEIMQSVKIFSELTKNHLDNQDIEAKKYFEQIGSKITLLSDQNRYLSKQIWTNRLISIIGFVLIIIVLGLLIYKLKFKWT